MDLMTDQEVNKIIAKFMRKNPKLVLDKGSCTIGNTTYLAYTASLDALAPVWEKFNILIRFQREFLDNTGKWVACDQNDWRLKSGGTDT